MLRVFFILFLVTSCLQDKQETPKIKESQSIATLKHFSNEVEYKKQDLIEWKAVSENLGFIAYDKVKTGIDSRAEVEFKDHSLLHIHPESIAVIIDRQIKSEDLSILEISKGVVEGKLLGSKTNQKVLEVRNKVKKIRLKNTSKKSSTFKIDLKEEEIEVKTDTGEKILIQVEDKDYQPKQDSVTITKDNVQINSPVEEPKKVKVKSPYYKLTYPDKDLSVQTDSIQVTGETYKYKVLLNGTELTPSGQFNHTFKLNPGLNILTFQFILGDKIEFKVFKVTRK